MKEATNNVISLPVKPTDALTEILRHGAKSLLAQAIEAEVADYIEQHRGAVDGDGRRLVVRNGRAPEREIQTPLGQMAVHQPRVNDKRLDAQGRRLRFTSAILPPYLRRTKSIEELIPWLYLRGISTGDFTDALSALLGKDAPGLSATTVVRLKEVWKSDYDAWSKRSLKGKRYVYIWADGIHCNIRLGDDERMCLLVIMGATVDGTKELIAVEAGHRESTLSWKSLLLSLRERGLDQDPELACGDGALGFWAALEEVFPKTKRQRCWVHKTANVLDKLPKSKQPEAKRLLHDIYMSDNKWDANRAYEHFIEIFSENYAKATACLSKDHDDLFSFFAFPKKHWKHIRSTNPIESTFATVRLRTKRTKGCGSVSATLTMVFKLAQCAERSWKKLHGAKLLADVIDARFVFVDGVRKDAAA